MIPIIAIVGRPNVGKSTLFNRLTRSRDALVADVPGLTRDRQFGEGKCTDRSYIVIDTGGMYGDKQGIDSEMLKQSKQAIAEADAILFVVDGRAGRTTTDEAIAHAIRKSHKTIYLVVNKTDGIEPHAAGADFYPLGLGEPHAIAAVHGHGVTHLITHVLDHFPHAAENEMTTPESGIKIAIIGRPNVGKSTLVNRILGEARMVVYDEPGTTRDSIYIPFERFGKAYTIIDTAGVRRRSKVARGVEKFSIIKTLQAIESAHVVVFLVDATEGIVEQDLNLLGFVLDAGKALVLAINKWDGLSEEHKVFVRKELQRRLRFLDFAKLHFISALHGSNVGHLFDSIHTAYAAATKKIATHVVTALLTKAVALHEPPMVRGRRIKLRYAHVGGHNPPVIVIHGNQTQALPLSYKRYLVNMFREELKLYGTPVRIELKNSINPYQGRKNKLTEMQKRKRQRMLKKVKRK